MLFEVDSDKYKSLFPTNFNPFITDSFIEINESKTEKVIRLVRDTNKPAIGLIAGIKNNILKSHFSAPFGGFHFRNENVFVSEVDTFLIALQNYILSRKLAGIEITLPPDIYHPTFNAKAVNSLVRNGFTFMVPDITCWVNLQEFNGTYTNKKTRCNYHLAVRSGLTFELASLENDKREIYNLIRSNRERYDRPIFMTYEDVLEICKLWPVDFFKVSTRDGSIVASAILYRNHSEICYAVFWGDHEMGRPLRAMDFLVLNLLSYYKAMGYKYLDLGISSKSGIPNEGLLRFKECHETTSSLRYRFIWEVYR